MVFLAGRPVPAHTPAVDEPNTHAGTMRILTSWAQALSRLVYKHARGGFGLERWCLRVGHEILDFPVATRVIRRPEWLRAYSKPLPSEFAPRLAPDKASDE